MVESCGENPAEVDREGNLSYCSLARFSSSTNSVRRFRPGTSSHIWLLCVEGGKCFLLFALWHIEVIKGEGKLRRDLIEHFGWDVQIEMGFVKGFARVLIWSACHRGDPERPSELEPWQPRLLFLGVPFLEFWVCIDDFLIFQKLVAEAVHHRGDGVDST